MKSYIFRVIVEEDALEDVKRITPPAQPSKGATLGATRTLKRSPTSGKRSSFTSRISWRPEKRSRWTRNRARERASGMA